MSAFHTPFIQEDIDALGRHYTVRRQIGHGLRAALKIVTGVIRYDVAFCWFASTYAAVAVAVGRMFNAKCIIVVGGVDVAKDKDLNYGVWLSPWRARLVGYALRNADSVLVVDPSLKREAVQRASYDGENISYLPTGYDGTFWKPVGEKERIVLCVAMVGDEQRFRVKGIDVLIEAARELSDVPFVVVGVEQELALKHLPPFNMTFYPPMDRRDLLPFYQRARVYCQPSRREGMPNTLCEAMLCGCIPVAAEVGGNASAVGEAGFVITSGDAKILAGALRQALASGGALVLKARMRIVSLFPGEKREHELVRIVNGLLR